jgi:hypothetical protein
MKAFQLPRALAAARLSLSALIAFVALAAPTLVQAHTTSITYLTAKTTEGGDTRLTWDIPVADLHWTLDLDSSNGDGLITWGEIEERRDDIVALALSHLAVTRNGTACHLDAHAASKGAMFLKEHAEEPHISLDIHATCNETAGPLALQANLFFDTNPTQRTLIDIDTPKGQFTSILSPASQEWVQPATPSILAAFTTFIGQGMWHVWIGYDHLAFLALLLLPGVLRSTGSGWQATRTLGETASDLFRTVTAFTLAHSITLSLAATGSVTLPERPIEIAIAASIIVAGLLNLWPEAARARLAIAFSFGLVHGFGFANALSDLGVTGSRLIPALAGFNVGVELAQLSSIALVLPLLFRARTSAFYAWRFMPATSLVAALAGGAWLAARAG